jgi:hypothetical protein
MRGNVRFNLGIKSEKKEKLLKFSKTFFDFVLQLIFLQYSANDNSYELFNLINNLKGSH